MERDYGEQLAAARVAEKKALFKNASFLGVLLIVYNILNSVYLEVYYLAVYTYFNKSITLDVNTAKQYLREQQYEFVQTTSFSMTANLFVVMLSAVTLLIIAQCIMRIRVTDLVRPYRCCVKQGLQWTPVCITLNLLISIVVAVFVQAMNQNGVTVPEADFTISSPSNYAVVIQLVYVCIIGPIIEELIYRGLIIKLLSPFGKGLAVFFSALIFGLMHGNISQAASAFAGALIYAMVAVRFNSIVPTIIIHVINNCFASITDIGDAIGWAKADELYLAIQIVMMFIGFYTLIVKLSELVSEIKHDEPICAMQTGKRFTAVFTNVFMLIYFLYIISEFAESFILYNS